MTEHMWGARRTIYPKLHRGAPWQLLINFPLLFARIALGPFHFPQPSVPIHLQVRDYGPWVGQDGHFLCPACRYVHEYSAPDVQLILPHTDPRRAGTSYNVVYIRLQCREQGCASILRIRTLVAFDKCPHEEATAMFVSSEAHSIPCGNGHILSGPIDLFGLVFDAHFRRRIGRSGKAGTGGLLRDCSLKSACTRIDSRLHLGSSQRFRSTTLPRRCAGRVISHDTNGKDYAGGKLKYKGTCDSGFRHEDPCA